MSLTTPVKRWRWSQESSSVLLEKGKEKESDVAQACLTLGDPMDCSLSGSSAHGIFQARVLEWGAIKRAEYKYPPPVPDETDIREEA